MYLIASLPRRTNAQITAAPSVSVPLVSGCPAIVLVTLLCNTCVTLDCIETAVVTAGCRGCPSTAATVRTGYPCDQGCAGLGGCKTVYNIVSAQDPGECEAVTIGTGTETAGSGSATEGSSSSTSEVPTIGSIIPDETTTTTEISGLMRPFLCFLSSLVAVMKLRTRSDENADL